MADDYEELRDLTIKTAKMLFGEPPKKDEPSKDINAYGLWKQFAPDLAPHLSMFYTGRLYAREVISQKQRELCAVAVLTVLHMPEELRAHIKAAMNVGATTEEIAEVMIQTTTYHGVPTSLEALKVLKAYLEETEGE